jgi:CheY-like chemotaxis protein
MLTNAIRKLINDRASEGDLRYAARQTGMVLLREDALAKIREGITSPDEVLRVVQIDETEVPCPTCKVIIEADFATCPYCGTSLKTNCAACGQPLRLDWKLCPYCNSNALVQTVAEGVWPRSENAATAAEAAVFAAREAAPLAETPDEGESTLDLLSQAPGPDIAPEAPALAPDIAPAAPALAPLPPIEKTIDPNAGRDPLRVLVVDDDADIRMIVRATLRGLPVPVDVVEAENGFRALEQVKAAPPDLVVLDVMMPEMDGFETCRALREDLRTAFIPILMLTASADQDSRTKGYLIGTDDYMAKPFLPVDLKMRIARLLRRTYGI